MCGANDQTANAYCKRCGEWLPDMKARTRIAFGGETPQQNIVTGLFMCALSSLAALFSAIALYATYLGSGEAKWSVYATAAICLCIAGWQASSFVVSLKLRQRLKGTRDTLVAATELGAKRPTQVLDAGATTAFVSVPSVTENTTGLLETTPQRNRQSQTNQSSKS